MLLLISILLLTLYFQNRISNKNYLIQISKNYKKNFDTYYSFLQKNLIDFYERQTMYLDNNPNNINQLINNEKYLKEVKIVDLSKQKISTIYSKELEKKKSFTDIQVTQDMILYKVIVPMINQTGVYAYAEYILDSRVLLQRIKDFDGSNGILYVKDNNKSNDVFLDQYGESDFFKAMTQECENAHDSPVVKYLSKTYLKKEFFLKDFRGDDVANALFFLDTTKDGEAYKATVRESMITSIILFIFAAVAVWYYFNYLIKKIEENENDLKNINKNLEQLVEQETQHRLEIEHEAQKEKQKNEQLLIQQSKLALLGEMIGNIAHQWRQPLMQLSAILMYLDAYNEKGKLNEDKLLKKVKEGNSIIDFMSKTIEDFRNYYKPEKQKEQFLIKESIDSALFILNSALKNANISVTTNYGNEDITLMSYKNEFSQALLNIITNAKDILIQREIENPTISIEVVQKEDTIMLSVSDNAGGIDETILGKVFDPYFTTKHKSQGTGIGLYMTKMIIENNMEGQIRVENEKEGATFVLTLKA